METALRSATNGLLEYIQASPTPYHAIACTLELLKQRGFAVLLEGDPWSLDPGGRYCVTRNGSALAAFILGSEPPAEAGFRVIGAHSDSPGLRLKPVPGFVRHGYIQLGVEVYGGPILASWVDRDLGVAGRVCLRTKTGFDTRLVMVDRPVARVPEVAIHLDREVNDKGLVLNRENHLPPILGLTNAKGWDLAGWLGAELKVDPKKILDHDLMLFDLTAPALGGLEGEFIFASRLDNLASCYTSVQALVADATGKTAATRVVVLYDNEEIGSNTRQGASGPFLDEVLRRIVDLPVAAGVGGRRARSAPGAGSAPGPRAGSEPTGALFRARSHSWLLSSDMAHAAHPNYADRLEAHHVPQINGGPVIKYNANARYATDGVSGAFFQSLCRDARVPFQKYVNRADLPCGSTIGPVVSTRLGIRTVDIGCAMLSMHSCREMAGARDPGYMIRAMRRFLAA